VRQTQRFYSRRVGLGGNGTSVTIPLGVRAQGRTLGNHVGLSAMRTGDTEQASNVLQGLQNLVVLVNASWSQNSIPAPVGGHYRVRGVQSSVTANTVRLRSDYAFSTRLNNTLFAQRDSQYERASVIARVRWTVKPGSDLFVVWNSIGPTGRDRLTPRSRPSRGGLLAKYVYFFRS